MPRSPTSTTRDRRTVAGASPPAATVWIGALPSHFDRNRQPLLAHSSQNDLPTSRCRRAVTISANGKCGLRNSRTDVIQHQCSVAQCLPQPLLDPLLLATSRARVEVLLVTLPSPSSAPSRGGRGGIELPRSSQLRGRIEQPRHNHRQHQRHLRRRARHARGRSCARRQHCPLPCAATQHAQPISALPSTSSRSTRSAARSCSAPMRQLQLRLTLPSPSPPIAYSSTPHTSHQSSYLQSIFFTSNTHHYQPTDSQTILPIRACS